MINTHGRNGLYFGNVKIIKGLYLKNSINNPEEAQLDTWQNL